MKTTTSPQRRLVLVVGATGKTGTRVPDPPALQGVGVAYVTYRPDLVVPTAAADIAACVSPAHDAGVERLVLLSGRGEPQARVCEQIVLTGAIPATVLRCSWLRRTSALNDAGHSGRLYVLTGPRVLSFADVAKRTAVQGVRS